MGRKWQAVLGRRLLCVAVLIAAVPVQAPVASAAPATGGRDVVAPTTRAVGPRFRTVAAGKVRIRWVARDRGRGVRHVRVEVAQRRVGSKARLRYRRIATTRAPSRVILVRNGVRTYVRLRAVDRAGNAERSRRPDVVLSVRRPSSPGAGSGSKGSAGTTGPGAGTPGPPTASAVRLTGLETNADPAPLGIDTPKPRLGWRLEAERRGVQQRAVEVRVERDGRMVWESGRVDRDDPWLDYDGPALASHTRYAWSVRAFDETGDATPWASSWFETAFMDPAEWQAPWIAGPPPPAGCDEQPQCLPAPLLRREFKTTKPVANARLLASGMGYGTYRINGRRVGDAVMDPGFTEYTERAFYVVHDVTDLLQQGTNAIGAELGRGPFGQVGSNFTGYQNAPWHADPRLRLELRLTYADGSTDVVRSGTEWQTIDGPIRFDDIMLGETYDARRAKALEGWDRPGFDAAAWVPARAVDGPKGRLEAQAVEPIRPQERIAFKAVKQVAPDTWQFDLRDNVAGNAVLDTDLPEGKTITLRYGEKLVDGRIDTSGGSFDGPPFQLDRYTAGPGRDRWRPEFTYKGFQYVEVSGLTEAPPLSMLEAEVWYTDWPATGSFKSSNDLINQIHDVSRRSIVSNTHSIPTDTPIYEKTGYTADGQLVVGAASFLFDTRRFYEKWLVDIEQSVAPSGDMPIVAPAPSDPAPGPQPIGFYYTSPGWDAALHVVADELKRFAGDDRSGVEALPEMLRVRGFYDTQARDGVIPGSCTVVLAQQCPNGLGDWTAPAGASYGAALDSTAWWYEMLRVEEDVAARAGDVKAAEAARVRRAQVARGFDRAFWDPVRGYYRDPAGTTPGDLSRPGPTPAFHQHQNAMALALGLVPADRRQAVGDALAADVRNRGGHLFTGIMGTRFLFTALASTGHVDEAVATLTRTTYPSYGYWLRELGWHGLGEFWEKESRSLNHQMYGSVVQWLYEELAGIKPLTDGFEQIEVRPRVPASGVDHAEASTATPRGRVASSWRKLPGGRFALTVTVPPTASAVVHLPTQDATKVTEGGVAAVRAPGVVPAGRVEDGTTFRVGSGTYRFEIAG